MIGNLRYYCGNDHLPHLKQDTQGYCETGYECLSGLCNSNACYGNSLIDNIPVLDPIEDITVAVGNPVQFYVSANRPTPGTLDYSATHLPSGATFEYRTFKWTPILTGTYHVLFKVTSDGKFVDYLIVNITVVAPIYDAAKNTAYTKTNMYVNKTYHASVSMRNTGNTCWRKQDGYKLGFYNPIDGSPWNINRVELNDTDMIIPGNIKTFSFEVKSPINEGQYNFQWRMVKENGASSTWFGEETDNLVVEVTKPDPAAINNQANITTYCMPSEIIQGKTYYPWVQVKNTGSSTWTKEDGYKLGSKKPDNNNYWGLRRVELNTAELIKPDKEKIFVFPIRVLQTGTYNFSWQMVHESVGWFGNTIEKTVTVKPPNNNAAFIEYRDIPQVMRPGEIRQVSVCMKNTGDTDVRKQDRYRLGFFNLGGESPWGINRIELNEGETIKKNQNKTFNFTIVAPTTSGEYHFQWLMVHEGIEWFGQDSEYKVIKVHPDNIYCHSADTNKDWKISHGELLRVIQLMNAGEYHCQAGSEDGYAPGAGEHICQPHSADTNSDWKINFTELLRVVQFYNSRGYDLKEGTEDGFAPIN